jgi:hypothetical protein
MLSGADIEHVDTRRVVTQYARDEATVR